MRNVNVLCTYHLKTKPFGFILTMRNVNIIVPIIPIPIGKVLY